MSALRCAQILASIDDSTSGPSYSVPRLSAELRQKGVHVTLFTVSGWRRTDGSSDKLDAIAKHLAYNQDFTNIPILRRLCFSHELMNALSQCASDIEIYHSHGLWLMPNLYPAWACRRSETALVVSPRGMLGRAALRFSRLKKLGFWYALQRSAMCEAKCLHATSDQEYEEIRAFGLHNPVAMIRNGIDLPNLTEKLPMKKERIVLSLGRIHPKKGLDMLVKAWAMVESQLPGWNLKIVGSDEAGYANKIKVLASECGASRITFEDPLYGDAKFSELQNADIFVLPSLNENFGLVVAEALASGTPVISTKGTPWSELPMRGCGWWIDAGVDSLAATLTEAAAMPRQTLKNMGAKGREWMAKKFSWEGVADDMLQVYRWLATKSDMPPTVRLK